MTVRKDLSIVVWIGRRSCLGIASKRSYCSAIPAARRRVASDGVRPVADNNIRRAGACATYSAAETFVILVSTALRSSRELARRLRSLPRLIVIQRPPDLFRIAHLFVVDVVLAIPRIVDTRKKF